MRPQFLFASMLLLFSACDRNTPPRASSESEIFSMEQEYEGEFLPNSSLPAKKDKSATSKDPITLEVIDDARNPIISQQLLTEEEASAGWISLFDGASLFGWKSVNPDVNWKVVDGVLTADVGPVGLLCTTVPFADYELVCEFRMEANGNSGVFLRTIETPVELDRDCFEVNIADEQPEGFLTGSIVKHATTEKPLKGSGDWKTFRISAKGNHITVELDGKQVLDYTDKNPNYRKVGLIGLQQRFGKIEFRKINLRPLSLANLFDGETLTGWQTVPGSEATFSVDEETIKVKGGVGFLETKNTYKDFIFQIAARTDAHDVNSGFFFRTEPGTEAAPSNGYEVQIHSGFKDLDRSRPSNAGTGAIFRRIEARRVVTNDLEWATITLVANGSRSAVWVDGFQVVDWEDTRAPNPNPRRGLQLEGGHISLQGHDPGTEASFRNMKAAELPAAPVATAKEDQK